MSGRPSNVTGPRGGGDCIGVTFLISGDGDRTLAADCGVRDGPALADEPAALIGVVEKRGVLRRRAIPPTQPDPSDTGSRDLGDGRDGMVGAALIGKSLYDKGVGIGPAASGVKLCAKETRRLCEGVALCIVAGE